MLAPFPAPPRWAADFTRILNGGLLPSIPKPPSPSPVRGSAPSPPVPWLPSPTATLQKEMSTLASTSSCLPHSLARGSSEAHLLSAVSPLPWSSSLLSPSPSCPPWQVPLSAWVRVLPQERQKVGGAGTWALTSDTRGTSWAALGSSFFLCAPVSSALKWGGPHRGDPPGPARVWKHWPSLRHGPAQGGCGSDRALSSVCQSLERGFRDSHGPDKQAKVH